MFSYRPIGASPVPRLRNASFVVLTVLSAIAATFIYAPGSATADEPKDRTSASYVSSPYSANSIPGLAADTLPTKDQAASFNSMMNLASMAPSVITPEDTVKVRLLFTNTTESTLKDLTVNFNLTRLRFSTRSGLDAWDARELGDSAGDKLATETLDKKLKPGATATFEFSVDASQLALVGGVEGWGPRGVTFEAWGVSDERPELLDALNTYLLWYPAEDLVEPNLNVATVLPITGLAADPLATAATSDDVLNFTRKDSSLSHAIAAVSEAPHVSLAVDPAFVESIYTAATTPVSDETVAEGTQSPSPSSSTSDSEEDASVTFEQKVAQDWLATFTHTAASREILSLPSYDVDFNIYKGGSSTVPRSKAANYESLAGLSFADHVAWPVAQAFTADSVRVAGTSEYPLLVAEAGTLTNDPSATFTRSGTFTTELDPSVTILDADEGLTELLQTPRTVNPIQERQRLVAELAVMSKEQPSKSRDAIIALDRNWNPSVAVAREQLKALTQLPWVKTADLTQLADSKSVKSLDVTLPQDHLTPTLFNRSEFTELRETQKAISKLSRIAEDPRQLNEPYLRAHQRLLSQAWLTNLPGHANALKTYNDAAQVVLDSITVVPSSDINMISTGAEIPLTVQNNLDQPVKLNIRLSPNDPRLQARTVLPLDIDTQSSESVRVPVTAVGSGNVNVTVDILDPEGNHIASPGTFNVRVRADWENVGTGVVLSLLALLLAGGIWRTIRRGRSERRVAGLDTEEALAVVEAQAEERK